MRALLVSGIIALSGVTFSQNSEFEVWTQVGAEGDVIKKLDWSASLSTRFGNRGVNTFFPEFGLEYKLKKWLRPSIEYRYVAEKDEYTNYISRNRLNFNLTLKESIDRLSISGRIRYQYAFDRLASSVNFNPEFDRAIRTKLGLKYDLNDNIFSPTASAELFFDPKFSATNTLSKVRIGLGTDLELDGPHSFDFKYQIDTRLDPSKDSRHAISLSYCYKF